MAQVPWRPVWQRPVTEEEAAALLNRCISRMERNAVSSSIFPFSFDRIQCDSRNNSSSSSSSNRDVSTIKNPLRSSLVTQDVRFLQQSEVYRQLKLAAAAFERQPCAQLCHRTPPQQQQSHLMDRQEDGDRGMTRTSKKKLHCTSTVFSEATAQTKGVLSASADENDCDESNRRNAERVIDGISEEEAADEEAEEEELQLQKKRKGVVTNNQQHISAQGEQSGLRRSVLHIIRARYLPEFHGVWLAFDNVRLIEPGASLGASAFEKKSKARREAEGELDEPSGESGRRKHLSSKTAVAAAISHNVPSSPGMGYVIPDTSTGGGLLLFEAVVDCLVFIPKRNAMLVGRVLAVRPTHLRLLWLDVFSVVVEQGGIPSSFTYSQGAWYLDDDEHEDVLCLTGSLAKHPKAIFPSLAQLIRGSTNSSSDNGILWQGQPQQQQGSSSIKHQQAKGRKDKDDSLRSLGVKKEQKHKKKTGEHGRSAQQQICQRREQDDNYKYEKREEETVAALAGSSSNEIAVALAEEEKSDARRPNETSPVEKTKTENHREKKEKSGKQHEEKNKEKEKEEDGKTTRDTEQEDRHKDEKNRNKKKKHKREKEEAAQSVLPGGEEAMEQELVQQVGGKDISAAPEGMEREERNREKHEEAKEQRGGEVEGIQRKRKEKDNPPSTTADEGNNTLSEARDTVEKKKKRKKKPHTLETPVYV